MLGGGLNPPTPLWDWLAKNEREGVERDRGGGGWEIENGEEADQVERNSALTLVFAACSPLIHNS